MVLDLQERVDAATAVAFTSASDDACAAPSCGGGGGRSADEGCRQLQPCGAAERHPVTWEQDMVLQVGHDFVWRCHDCLSKCIQALKLR